MATIGDAGVDTMITSGALDSVPVLGILNGIYKVTRNFRTLRLCKKVAVFLYETSCISQKETDKFIREYTEANKEKGAEILLAVIDKIDNVNKINYLCNLMKVKINGEISIGDFIRLCHIIERLPYVDFKNLEKYKTDFSEVGTDDVLLSSGVVYNSILDMNDGNKYRLNHLGELLLKHGLHIETELDTPTSVSKPNTQTSESLSDTFDSAEF